MTGADTSCAVASPWELVLGAGKGGETDEDPGGELSSPTKLSIGTVASGATTGRGAGDVSVPPPSEPAACSGSPALATPEGAAGVSVSVCATSSAT